MFAFHPIVLKKSTSELAPRASSNNDSYERVCVKHCCWRIGVGVQRLLEEAAFGVFQQNTPTTGHCSWAWNDPIADRALTPPHSKTYLRQTETSAQD